MLTIQILGKEEILLGNQNKNKTNIKEEIVQNNDKKKQKKKNVEKPKKLLNTLWKINRNSMKTKVKRRQQKQQHP